MTAFLPPNLLALFAARDPIPYLPPADKLGHEKKRNSFGGVAVFLQEFEDPKDTPPPTRVETKDERKERKRKERAEQIAYKLEQDLALWDPHSQNTSTDPYKTLFVARINYDTSESKMRREFEVYGPIRKIKLIGDKSSGKPRGYAFIEYEHERDMHSAYKHADGKKIDGRRVLVDVERGRTVKGWRPRRLVSDQAEVSAELGKVDLMKTQDFLDETTTAVGMKVSEVALKEVNVTESVSLNVIEAKENVRNGGEDPDLRKEIVNVVEEVEAETEKGIKKVEKMKTRVNERRDPEEVDHVTMIVPRNVVDLRTGNANVRGVEVVTGNRRKKNKINKHLLTLVVSLVNM